MIIKNITIKNFRSYYKDNPIDIGNGLTLIIGSNGDGKTTMFEAVEWLFDTVGTLPKADNKYISKKRISELLESESDYVRVSMTYVNNGGERIIQKSFKFTKSLSGEISTSNFAYDLYIQQGVEKDVISGEAATRQFDRDFAPSIRKYCLFKGEQNLNIFNNDDAMSYLVETFSQIRDFDPYLSFMENAKVWAEKATDNAIKADRKNSSEAQRLRSLITNEERVIGEIETELQNKRNEATNFQTLLEGIEKNKETSSLLVNTNSRLESLVSQKQQAQKELNENYTFRLLDDMWILMGYEPIAEEYRNLVGNLDKEQRKQQSKLDQEIGAKRVVAQINKDLSNGHVPLSLNIPDENTMREMIDEEFCKVCGRPAPKGSEPYLFMKKRLDDYLASLEIEEDKEDKTEPLFRNSYIKELCDRYSVLHNNMKFLNRINGFIDNAVWENLKKHEIIDRLSSNIEQEEEKKKQILAQTDGLSEDELVSAYNNISEWWKARSDAERRSDFLEAQVKKHKDVLDGYRSDFSKISEDSSAAMYSRTSQAIRRILDSFVSAKIKNKRDFLDQLEEVTNEYLELLNKGDFRGYAQIIEKPNSSAEIILIDTDGSRIYNANTALKTTMYMSLLFAVAKLTTVKHENDYPLIFDAPTSSFTAAKESDFFGVIAGINKQTIIVTKSFLVEDSEGNSSLDRLRLDEIDAKKYRIEKAHPFNEKDLSTIHTFIKPI
jgi:DNA sulfur modification protein DndD